MKRTDREPAFLLVVMLVLLAASAVHCHDLFTWVLEVMPIFLGVPILVATHPRFPLTPLAYRLLFLHAIVLMVGGHWTYANVPLGFWVRDLLHLSRNHYDRLGHFAQGFVPAILAREILLRKNVVRPGGFLFFLVVCVCQSISAWYEFIEWWTALGTGTAATAFLGTQGDPWDTQWDMFMALVGAVTAQWTLARVHSAQVVALRESVGSADTARSGARSLDG